MVFSNACNFNFKKASIHKIRIYVTRTEICFQFRFSGSVDICSCDNVGYLKWFSSHAHYL